MTLHLNLSQVPSEDWGGGYGGGGDSGGEIPCRRMRSGSYIKAMGDDDSADSDTSPKASPKSTLIAQRDAFRRSISMDQRSNVTNGVFIFMLKDLWAACYSAMLITTLAFYFMFFHNKLGFIILLCSKESTSKLHLTWSIDKVCLLCGMGIFT